MIKLWRVRTSWWGPASGGRSFEPTLSLMPISSAFFLYFRNKHPLRNREDFFRVGHNPVCRQGPKAAQHIMKNLRNWNPAVVKRDMVKTLESFDFELMTANRYIQWKGAQRSTFAQHSPVQVPQLMQLGNLTAAIRPPIRSIREQAPVRPKVSHATGAALCHFP